MHIPRRPLSPQCVQDALGLFEISDTYKRTEVQPYKRTYEYIKHMGLGNDGECGGDGGGDGDPLAGVDGMSILSRAIAFWWLAGVRTKPTPYCRLPLLRRSAPPFKYCTVYVLM